MTPTEIQNRVNALREGMTAKGLREPEACFRVSSDNQEFDVMLNWRDGAKQDRLVDRTYHVVRGADVGKMLNEADAYVANLPTADETRLAEFMGALGRVIDLGRKNGVEVAYLNPLTETMKQLSENVVTDQREVA